MPVTMRDLTRILDAVRTVNEADDEAFERTMLTTTADLIACDTISYNEHRLDRGEELACVVEPSYLERSPARQQYLRHLGHHPADPPHAGRQRGPEAGLHHDRARLPRGPVCSRARFQGTRQPHAAPRPCARAARKRQSGTGATGRADCLS